MMVRYTSLRGKGIPLETLIEFYIRAYPDIFKLGFICYSDPQEGEKSSQSETDEVIVIDPAYDVWQLGDSQINFLELWEAQRFEPSNGKWIGQLAEELRKKNNENLGLLSFVFTPIEPGDPLLTGFQHIPMIDFHCSISENNQGRVLEFLGEIGEESGILVESGQSYHYYGDGLMTQAEWEAFTEGLKQTPLIGERWPALQLGNRFANLRITTSEAKPTLPAIIGIIGDAIVVKEGRLVRKTP